MNETTRSHVFLTTPSLLSTSSLLKLVVVSQITVKKMYQKRKNVRTRRAHRSEISLNMQISRCRRHCEISLVTIRS